MEGTPPPHTHTHTYTATLPPQRHTTKRSAPSGTTGLARTAPVGTLGTCSGLHCLHLLAPAFTACTCGKMFVNKVGAGPPTPNIPASESWPPAHAQASGGHAAGWAVMQPAGWPCGHAAAAGWLAGWSAGRARIQCSSQPLPAEPTLGVCGERGTEHTRPCSRERA
jgi:hypothetical protein